MGTTNKNKLLPYHVLEKMARITNEINEGQREVSYSQNDLAYDRTKLELGDDLPDSDRVNLDHLGGNMTVVHKMLIYDPRGRLLFQEEGQRRTSPEPVYPGKLKPVKQKLWYLPAGRNRANENLHEGRDRKLVEETGLTRVGMGLIGVKWESHWLELVWRANLKPADMVRINLDLSDGCEWRSEESLMESVKRFEKGEAEASDRESWARIRFWDIGSIIRGVSEVNRPLTKLGGESSSRNLVLVSIWRKDMDPVLSASEQTWEMRKDVLRVFWPMNRTNDDIDVRINQEIRRQVGRTVKCQRGMRLHGISEYSHHGVLSSQGFVSRIVVSYQEFREWDESVWLPGSLLIPTNSFRRLMRMEFEAISGRKVLPKIVNQW